MSILSDSEIIKLCQGEVPMLSPYHPNQVRYRVDSNLKSEIRIIGGIEVKDSRVISYGVSSYGYDCCLSDETRIFTNLNGKIIDPKNLDEKTLVQGEIINDETGRFVILPPNSYLLGCTIETFNMPKDVLSICLAKSTYARAGIGINVTPIEPGFIGQVVIEVSNMTSLPVKIYLNEGIAQFLFFRGNQACAVSYGDRKGKYQNQTGITLPKV